jgi:hypothetical protein
VEGMIQAPTIILQIKEHPESLMQICHLSGHNKVNDASIIMTEGFDTHFNVS